MITFFETRYTSNLRKFQLNVEPISWDKSKKQSKFLQKTLGEKDAVGNFS